MAVGDEHWSWWHHYNQRMTLGTKNQGASVVLMLLTELGAIEGFTNSKADHQYP
jgi:hypothetical protein